jgi:hypothetical protein
MTEIMQALTWCLPFPASRTILRPMFVVTEADAAAIRTAYEQEGELSAAIELRRRFPGITNNEQARQCARSIAGWTPPSVPAAEVVPLRPRARRRLRPAVEPDRGTPTC